MPKHESNVCTCGKCGTYHADLKVKLPDKPKTDPIVNTFEFRGTHLTYDPNTFNAMHGLYKDSILPHEAIGGYATGSSTTSYFLCSPLIIHNRVKELQNLPTLTEGEKIELQYLLQKIYG
jgi:hypothetical protein